MGEEAKIEELTNLAKTVQADFENYKKRVEAEKPFYIKQGELIIFKELIPIYEALEKAKDESQGAKLVFEQLKHLFENHNVKKLPSETFDSRFHEAIMVENNSEIEDNKITEVFQNGWEIDEQILIHAKVKVNKTGGVKNE